ncbi:hypothetical protein KOW79_011098 [Hemibagrus wyckioides]|uniref:Uncharacterized protein n=1 Tax=Hemibagrus wyckioides TaxID=337641 RepID=A0A9D3NPT8_9TELE|nr:hypothetical protein KOW79_011098 [Hemibagrus wyckioides]
MQAAICSYPALRRKRKMKRKDEGKKGTMDQIAVGVVLVLSTVKDTSPPVNPVDITQLDAMIMQQGQALVVHQELQAALQATNTQLRQVLGNPSTSGSKPVRMALPDKFDDTADTCKDERV